MSSDTTELKRLIEKCQELEAAVGIASVMERARESRLIPLGAIGDPVSPEEYFADEHDYLRRKTRNAYFAVEDIALRNQLIAIERQIDAEMEREWEAEINSANQEVAVAVSAARVQPWGKAASIAVISVALGYWIFDLVGAIAGAVGGFFLGQGAVSQSRAEKEAELERARGRLEQLLLDKAHRTLHPAKFNVTEECTGVRDGKFDNESAYANVLQARKDG